MKIFSRHASASNDFWRTCTSRKHARWLLDMLNNHHGIITRTENVRCTCASLKEPVRWPYDLTCTNDVRIYCSLHYTYVDWKSHVLIINIEVEHTVNVYLRHAYTNWSWCMRIANKNDFYFKKMIIKCPITIRESTVLPFIRIKSNTLVLNPYQKTHNQTENIRSFWQEDWKQIRKTGQDPWYWSRL